MIKFTNLIIKGFCSISDFEWNLNQNNTILIKGRNGVGKSSFISAIPWVLYGKTPKGVSNVNTWKSIRPKPYNGTMVQIFFEKDTTTYSVIRCQNYTQEVMGAKGKDRLIFLIDGVEVSDKKKAQIQELIVKTLGMSYNLFTNSLMFNQGTQKLIQDSGSDKKKLFEEVFELNYINIAKEIANKKLSELRYEILDFEAEIRNLKINIEESEETYEELRISEKSFKKDLRKRRKEIQEDIKSYQKSIDSLKFNPTLLTKSEKELASLQDLLDILNKEYKDNTKLLGYEPLKEKVKDIINTLEEGKKSKAYSKLVMLLSTLDQVTLYHGRKDDTLEKYNKVVDVINKQETIASKIEIYENNIKNSKKKLKALKEEKEKILSPKYKLKIKEYSDKLESIQQVYDKRLKKYEDHQWLINDPLGNKGLKSYIMESSLDFLNKTLDKYTDTLGFKVEFGIDLNTTKKDFYTLIEINGNYADYEELSGGQKQMVNLAMAFAMHESTSMSKGINLLFLDEAFESLSRDNIELVVELIRNLSYDKTIYLISHLDSLPLGNSKILSVDSRDGITTFG